MHALASRQMCPDTRRVPCIAIHAGFPHAQALDGLSAHPSATCPFYHQKQRGAAPARACAPDEVGR
eukprot:3935614-Rhodomonas_salina.1